MRDVLYCTVRQAGNIDHALARGKKEISVNSCDLPYVYIGFIRNPKISLDLTISIKLSFCARCFSNRNKSIFPL
jgi:hypothetical protein